MEGLLSSVWYISKNSKQIKMQFSFGNSHYKLTSECIFGTYQLKKLFFTETETKFYLFSKENMFLSR
jgi:hypothetical protein